MSDRRRRSPTPVKAGPNSLVASAAILDPAARKPGLKHEQWQEKAWTFYDTVPELRFASQRAGHALSRCRLFVARRPRGPGDEPEPVEEGPAVELLAQLGGGVPGQSQLLQSFGTHLTVPGISYLTGQQAPGAFQSWQVLSADELRSQGRGWEVKTDEAQWDPTPDDTLVIKIWRPHERFHYLPDSPCRAVLPVLNELQGLTYRIDAEISSRLSGAGIFIIPTETTFASPNEAFKDAPNPFVAQLYDAMRVSMQNPASPEARMPIVLKVPRDQVEAFKFLTFAVPLDDKAIALRTEATGRFATGMDMPAQVIEGMGDVKFWNAQFIGEDEIKLHVAPNMETICSGITLGYLQPGLEALGEPDDELIIWYDTSELNVRPDKSQSTFEAYDRLEVNGVALRREIGLEESDKPNAEELSTMAAIKMLTSPLTAPLVAERFGLAAALVVASEAATGNGQAAAPLEVVAPPGPPSGVPSPGPSGPPQNGQAAAAVLVASAIGLVAASDGLVVRALERAGNRVRQKVKPTAGADDDCPPSAMHECIGGVAACGMKPAALLDGAWERVDEIAPRFGVDPRWLRRELAAYTTELLDSGHAHSWESLERRLVGVLQ